MIRPVSDVVIRLARPQDLAALVAGNAAMALETEDRQLDAARLERGVRALLEDRAKGFYLVAEDDGRVVGQLMITTEWSDWRDGVFWWIQSVHVVPTHRRRGIYRRLHLEAERLAREAGACGLRLYVERENAGAQASYRSLGMKHADYDMFEVELPRD